MIEQGIKRRLQRIAATFNARARRFRVSGVVSWTMLLGLGNRCHYCSIELDLEHGTWDHVIAFERGGTNWISNIVRCCITCQREKHTKTPDEFAEHREMIVTCARPSCGNQFKPRYAERKRGMAKYCSHACAGASRGKGW